MDKHKQYQKPEVTCKGANPEPVEAGCCLQSCGGSPGRTHTPRNQTPVAQEVAVAASQL